MVVHGLENRGETRRQGPTKRHIGLRIRKKVYLFHLFQIKGSTKTKRFFSIVYLLLFYTFPLNFK